MHWFKVSTSYRIRSSVFCILSSIFLITCFLDTVAASDLESRFQNPPPEAAPWVYWYWMRGAVSRPGIKADLEAMHQVGLGGAYLFFIQGAPNPPLIDPPVHQMTPRWWDMVRYAMQEADRLGLKLGLHACDGFSLAGGPWITPALSMQKLVWTATQVTGGRRVNQVLRQPEIQENYYRDIAVLAFPSPPGTGVSTRTVIPKVTTDVPNVDPQFLVKPGNTRRLRSNKLCWIQYTFTRPFTCRSIRIRPDGTSFQPLRLRLSVSDDGRDFRQVLQLQPPRHGWQDGDADFTYAISAITSRYFRFVYDPNGTEPGSEDLDTAKWRPSLKVQRIELFSRAQIHQFEGKNGLVWRMSPATTRAEAPNDLCISQADIRDISACMNPNGRLQWNAPAGSWTLLRLGYTTTGHKNVTGGAAVGLECDKFNPAAVECQFDHWFGAIIRRVGPDLTRRVLKIFHTDSWEAGSQNWSPVFRAAFQQRRGYDPLFWLPVMAGYPVDSAAASEKFLLDIRTTIAGLVDQAFFGTMAPLAHAQGCQFSAESVAPTMLSDNLRHFGVVDIPMGEFWFRSPTHDKPNDILDAVSGAHLYGKPLVQAEAFTELRFAWDETPAMLKALGDRNYCLGINRLVYHVFTENPWLDRKPGMSLGPTGLFFQRDQTWFQSSRAWVDYARRCQALLQAGRPVVDIAVFTGEDLPSRGILPERLVSTLPGLCGPVTVQREQKRRANVAQPQIEMPRGVRAGANITNPADWIDSWHGYAYDSINPQALLHMAYAHDQGLALPGGMRYRVLVVPGPRPMSPSAWLSPATRHQLSDLIAAGVPVIMADSLPGAIKAPYRSASLAPLGIEPDVIVTGARDIAWTHRTLPQADLYFISNQQSRAQHPELSLRVNGRIPELWDPVTGTIRTAGQWQIRNGRTLLPLHLAPQGSVFVVLRQPTSERQSQAGPNWIETSPVETLKGPWRVTFDPNLGGPKRPVTFPTLSDWTQHQNSQIRSYSGTALYSLSFTWPGYSEADRFELDLGDVHDIADVTLNGCSCGTAWTAPYCVDITAALHRGPNQLVLAVTNTWANRLKADAALPPDQRITWTLNPERAGKGPALPAGLLGPVRILKQTKP